MSDDSIGRYEQMLAEDPQSRAFAPLAEAQRKAGRLDEAIKIAKTGLEVHPGYSGGLVVLGRALYEKGELDNAVEVLQKAISETPESYLGQKFLGKVLMDKGESKGALRALEAANFLSPEDEEVSRLLDEMKSKATPPETMEYKGKAAESAGKDQIVTYEQKPTTVDGIELSPLSVSEVDGRFSFSGGGTADPADITPLPVEDEVAPAGSGRSEATVVGHTGEDMKATVIEEESEQTIEIDSLDELGPEAAAFIREGESFVEESMEDSVEDFSDDASITVEEVMEVAVIELEEFMSTPVSPPGETATAEAPGAQIQPVSTPAHAPAPEPDSEPAPEPEPEPEPASTFAEATADKPAPAPAPESAPASAPVTQTSPPEQPSRSADREEQFSTETLADLYAQQGLIEKATNIYRQILDQTPDNETVRLKLDVLEAQTPPDAGTVQEVQSPEVARPEPPQKDDSEETLSVLEGWLENAERIKRP